VELFSVMTDMHHTLQMTIFLSSLEGRLVHAPQQQHLNT